jgi:hypothetical protein
MRYVQPNAGETAQLVFKPAVLIARNYQLYLYQNPVSCTGLMTIATGTGPSNQVMTKLQANTLNTLSLSGQQAGRQCKVNLSFVPKPGYRYQLDGTVDEAGCVAKLTDITQSAAPKAVESLLYRSKGSIECLPLNESSKPASENTKSTLDDFKNLLPRK